MTFFDLLEQLELPPTQVAEAAWDEAHRRVVRRRGVTAGAAAATAVVATVAVFAGLGSGKDAAPSPAPPPTTATTPAPVPLTQRLVIGGAWRSVLAYFPRLSLPSLNNATPLSTDPIERASLAIADPRDEAGALVLGEDGGWRRVDSAGLVPVTDDAGYTSPIVRPTSLSPDASRLALPQPNALVVVDLTDGSFRRYDVPGPANTYAIWADDDHVLVAEETASHGTLVDLGDGSLKGSSYGPSTAFLDDTTLTWAWSSDFQYSELDWGNRRDVRTRADNGAGFFPEPPLVKGEVVVGVGGVYGAGAGLPVNTNGIVAVDGSTGDVLAYLPTTRGKGNASVLLGWDDDRPIIGLSIPQESTGLYVVSWDWRHGELVPLGHIPSDWVSWGSGELH
jgi:hypothetical protein